MTFHRKSHVAILCTTLAVSSATAFAFAPNNFSNMQSSLVPRSAVIQRYRVDDGSSDVSQPKKESNVYSFLPPRLSSVQRMDKPLDFQEQVLEENDSLVVVRFYAEVCPSCRATAPLFRKWSREIDSNDVQSNNIADDNVWVSQHENLPVKVLEMPLNMATSSFFKDELQVEQLPYYHVYHPNHGLVEEQLALSKAEFDQLTNVVDCWSKGECEEAYGMIELESKDEDDCEEFC